MKMKELEGRTGVNREAIRFYIREGLLPEPEKPQRNVAIYTEEHVDRIQLIRQLKEERFLPLGVIKSMIDQRATDGSSSSTLPGLEFRLAARLGANSLTAKTVDDVLAESSLSREDLAVMEEDGVITIIDGPEGAMLSGQDARIAACWAAVISAGFTSETGYNVHDIKRYLDAAVTLAETEVEHFFDRLADTNTTDEAAVLAESGINLVDEIFTILHSKAIIRQVAKRNAEEVETP